MQTNAQSARAPSRAVLPHGTSTRQGIVHTHVSRESAFGAQFHTCKQQQRHASNTDAGRACFRKAVSHGGRARARVRRGSCTYFINVTPYFDRRMLKAARSSTLTGTFHRNQKVMRCETIRREISGGSHVWRRTSEKLTVFPGLFWRMRTSPKPHFSISKSQNASFE